MKLVVVGVGRVGLAILEQASWKEDIVVIDSAPERAERALARFPHVKARVGDATDERVLREAADGEPGTLISAIPDDPTNLMVCALAKRVGYRDVVTRVSGDNVVPIFAEVGAVPVQNPSQLTAEHLYHAFQVPDVRTFITVGEDAEVVTLALSPRSRMVDRAVRDIHFPRDALLIAINRGGKVIVPTADLVLKQGDVLTLVARTHLLDQIVGRVIGTPARHLTERLRAILRR